ncbi:MAG: hypothetical protein IJ770_04390 [Alphaproteobacteria bacterium]|nr:hypothetical protein [Alphaproteobacteria bacterium]
MSIQEKIAKIKNKAAQIAVKAAAVATLMSGTGAISSCAGNNENTDETKDKIEQTDKTKTSVVFRKGPSWKDLTNEILLENGDRIEEDKLRQDRGAFLEPGDTVTYEGRKDNVTIVAVRYKDGNKKVNFGKIGKIEKDKTY